MVFTCFLFVCFFKYIITSPRGFFVFTFFALVIHIANYKLLLYEHCSWHRDNIQTTDKVDKRRQNRECCGKTCFCWALQRTCRSLTQHTVSPQEQLTTLFHWSLSHATVWSKGFYFNCTNKLTIWWTTWKHSKKMCSCGYNKLFIFL